MPPGKHTKAGRLSEPKEHALAHSPFQLFTRLARCNRRGEGQLYCLELEGDPCQGSYQREGWLADFSQHLLSLILPVRPGWPWLGSPRGGFSSTGKEMAAVTLSLFSSFSEGVQQYEWGTHRPPFPHSSCSNADFFQSFLTYHLSKTDCNKN